MVSAEQKPVSRKSMLDIWRILDLIGRMNACYLFRLTNPGRLASEASAKVKLLCSFWGKRDPNYSKRDNDCDFRALMLTFILSFSISFLLSLSLSLSLEILDFGYPQNSETDTLKMYITTESIKSEQAVREDSSKITIQATGAMSWRRADVKYRKNEAFVDVIETVNLLMSSKGTVLRADVDGQILMRAYLSGTPECRFGLNDKLVLDKR